MAMSGFRQDWKQTYASKISTVEKAIKLIPRGRRILIGSGAAEPHELVEGLVEHGEHLADNDIVHLMTLGPAPYVQPGMEHRFRHTAFFIGHNVRAAVAEHVGYIKKGNIEVPDPEGNDLLAIADAYVKGR